MKNGITIAIIIFIYLMGGAATMAHSDNSYPPKCVESDTHHCIGSLDSFMEAIIWPLYWSYYLTDYAQGYRAPESNTSLTTQDINDGE